MRKIKLGINKGMEFIYSLKSLQDIINPHSTVNNHLEKADELTRAKIFDYLPPEIQTETTCYLSTPDLVHFAMASKRHWTLFEPKVHVLKLLHYAVRGEYDTVQKMLKKDINLIFKKGRVTDCSGRTFENISSFEYALWALDKHMWTKILDCLHQNKESKALLVQLCFQYNQVKIKGVTYSLNGKEITEKHFDFENTIIKELQTQVNLRYAYGTRNWQAIHKQWRGGVGGAQKLLPMHVVYEYCSNDPFDLLPTFPFQPPSVKEVYNLMTRKSENWFAADSKLGMDYAIFKGGRDRPIRSRQVVADEQGDGIAIDVDLDGIRALYRVRTQQFINLEAKLGEQMMVDNQPEVAQI